MESRLLMGVEPTMRRVLVLAPIGRDAAMICDLLSTAGCTCHCCADIYALCEELLDSDMAVIAEEALTESSVRSLIAKLRQQPMWSDIPLVVLALTKSSLSIGLLETLSPVANMTLIERPVRPFTLLTVARAAMRARDRQYLTRDHLSQLIAAREEISRQRDEREVLLTRERAAREEAERVGRMKDEFLSTLSHELRTPLNAISGWAQLLMHGDLSEDDSAKAIEIISRNTRTQKELIEDLLDMSRIISGKVRLDVRPVDLANLISDAVESVRPGAEAKGVKLTSSAGSTPALISGDPTRLQQVIWNLLTNAVKFTERGGVVEIALERVDSRIQISVRDSGIGIAAGFLPYVFDRFRQSDASTTRRYGGLGLGLSIVKQLVEMHGGDVTAESMGLGKGSLFRVTLPMAAALAPEQEREGPGVHPSELRRYEPTKLTGVTVLLIDDDADGRELIRRILEDCEAKVLTAHSVQSATRVLAETTVDVVVSDIGMPEQDGYDLIRAIRSSPRESLRALPAAALTAFARSEDRTRALRAGYNFHVSKPVDPGELVAVVEKLSTMRHAPHSRKEKP